MGTLRRTSKLAYEYIVSSGVLAKRQQQAYEYMYHNGPLSAMELTYGAKINGLWKQCSILKRRGLFIEVNDTYICSKTGREVILWDVTDSMPKELPKEKQAKKSKNEVIKLLKEQRDKYITLFIEGQGWSSQAMADEHIRIQKSISDRELK